MNNETNQGVNQKDSVLTILVEKYNSTKNEIYFIELWEQVKAFAFMQAKKYHEIKIDEKISIAQECLWKCCSCLKPGTNLLTLYGTVLNNKFYDEWVKKMQTESYKINKNATSLEFMYEDIKYEPIAPVDFFNIDLFIIECKLSELEKELCKLMYQGYKRYEILEKLKIKSNIKYNNLLNRLRDKIRQNYLIEGLIF